MFRELGYSSMIEYCESALDMSDAEAGLRLYVARLGRRFPHALELLAASELNISGLKLLAPHLTAENCVQLLDRARKKSKREIEIMLAEFAPKPDVPARTRKLPVARGSRVGASRSVAEPLALSLAPDCTAIPGSPAAGVQPSAAMPSLLREHVISPQPARARVASTTPLSPGRFKLQLTLGQEAHDKLEQLRELLRHQNPSGDLAPIIERATLELLEHTMKKRFAQTKCPRTEHGWPRARAAQEARVEQRPDSREQKARSRYIPRSVVREVYARDAGQCRYVSPDGRRCTSRGFLEFHHHETTHARGGEAIPANLRLACRAHNALYAERDYGRSFMRSKLQHAVQEHVPEHALRGALAAPT